MIENRHASSSKTWQRRFVFLFSSIGLFLCLLVPGLSQGQETQENYQIGAEDVLSITVWDHDDLSRVVTVSADGNFSFPLIGIIKAGGLTVRELENKIAKLLDKDYIVNPQVTIMVKEFKSKKVFILGEVLKPGAYYLSKSDTLLEVISKAGGATTNAGQEIIIVRPIGGTAQQPTSLDSENSQLFRIGLQALLAGNIQKNIGVQDGDTIYVPKASMYSVFGEVGKPGSYPLEHETTILEAISIAGGPTQNADTQKLELLRKEDGVQRKLILNIQQILKASEGSEEFMIRDGDVIYQPRAEFFFVMGEVNKPGTYKLEEGMTVTKAISVAGGFTAKASKKKVKIVREENGKQVEHRADPNELIQSQDIVQVPQSFF